MSKVSNFVMADDGLYYEDPTVCGEFKQLKWFLCFDDEDPPELVIEDEEYDKGDDKTVLRLHFVKVLLSHLQIQGLALKLLEPNSVSRRFFGGTRSKPANSWFVALLKRLPRKFIDGRKRGKQRDKINEEAVFLDPEHSQGVTT